MPETGPRERRFAAHSARLGAEETTVPYLRDHKGHSQRRNQPRRVRHDSRTGQEDAKHPLDGGDADQARARRRPDSG